MPISKKQKYNVTVEELMNSYEKEGKIGNITPKNKAHAEEIANAIAYKNEDINIKNTPTRDAAEKTAVNMYRKAYYDWREKQNYYNKCYLRAIQDCLIAFLGRTKYDKIVMRTKQEYIRDQKSK